MKTMGIKQVISILLFVMIWGYAIASPLEESYSGESSTQELNSSLGSPDIHLLRPQGTGIIPGSDGTDISVNLSRSIADSLYSFQPGTIKGTWSAWNKREHTSVTAYPDGTLLFTHVNGSVGLKQAGIGRDTTRVQPGEGIITASGREVKITRPGLDEWYRNGDTGIEQGMNVFLKPVGTGNLTICFSVTGGLVPAIYGETLVFSDQYGPVLNYSGLKASDSTGRNLPSSMHFNGKTLYWYIDDSLAEYPVKIDPVVNEDKILKASDRANMDNFGYSVALYYNKAIVGAPYADSGGINRGQAYIFYKDLGGTDNWGQQKILSASDEDDYDYFGWSVAISDDVAIVGAYNGSVAYVGCGKAYVFKKDGGGADNWGQYAIRYGSDRGEGDRFGYSVALSGDYAIIGAPYADSGGTDRGQAYIFARDEGGAGTWHEVTVLSASDKADSDNFGRSVAVSPYGTAVIGAPFADSGGDNRGQVYIYERDDGGIDNWGQTKVCHAWDRTDEDQYGWAVGVSGERIIVGARYADSGGYNRGKAYIHRRSLFGSGEWGTEKTLLPSDGEDGDTFGDSVGLSPDTAVVGSCFADSGGTNRGRVYVFSRYLVDENQWGEVKIITASDMADSDNFGSSIAINNDKIIIGAPNSDSGGTNRGQAYIQDRYRTNIIGVFRSGFWILDYNGNRQWDGTGSGRDKVAGFGMAGDIPVVGDWDYSVPGDKIGVFRGGTWLLDHNGNLQWDVDDLSVSLGQPGDIPVVGDWSTVKMHKSIGVFRNGFWILDKNSNYNWDGTGTGEDLVTGFGTTGDVPVVVKWGYTDETNIGVFRNGFWILDLNGNFRWDGTGAGQDIVAGFGMVGDVPVPKDWNDDTFPEIAVFRPGSGQWIIDNNRNFQWDGTGPGQDIVANLGQNGDITVTGDWDSRDTIKLGVFRNGFWILDYNGNYQWDGTVSDKVISFGTTGDIPVVGYLM
jgi:hypothetical protein